MKKLMMIILVAVLVLVGVASACKEVYRTNEDVIVSDKLVSWGIGADCNITLKQNTTFIDTQWMNKTGTLVYYNFGNLSIGAYNADIECNETNIATNTTNYYTGNCDFIVESESKMIIAMIILLPMLLGFIMLLGSFFLGDDHAVLKIFLFLLAPITFWMSLHMGMLAIIKYFDFPELQVLMGKTTYWTGMVFFVILAYYLLYVFMKAIHVAAQKKKERLQY